MKEGDKGASALDRNQMVPDFKNAEQAARSRVGIAAMLFIALGISAISIWMWRPNPAIQKIATSKPTEPWYTPLSDKEEMPPALIVLDGAAQTRRFKTIYGALWITYTLSKKPPDTDSVEKISARLGDLGWRPLKEDWLNPGMPSSHVRGWAEFLEGQANPPRRV